MTFPSVEYAAYLVAGLLFILSLAGLSKHETSERGLRFGMVGMALALLTTGALVIDNTPGRGVWLMLGAVAIGAVIGEAKKINPNIDPTRVREICLELIGKHKENAN